LDWAWLEQVWLLVLIPILTLALALQARDWWPRVAATPRIHMGLLAVLAAHLLLGAWLVPHGPWHGNDHGIERYVWFVSGSLADDLRSDGNGFHGHGWYVLLRLGSWLPGAPFSVTLVASTLATAVLFAGARLLGLRGDAALTIAAVHALLPVRLRMAGTLSLYVGTELTLCLALACTAWFLQVRRDGAYATAWAALVLAMHHHLEMLALAPALVGVMVLAAWPRFPLDLVRQPRRLALTALAVASMGPRLADLATFPQVMGMSVFSWTPKRPALLALAATPLVALAVRELRDRVPAWLHGGLLGAIGLATFSSALVALAQIPTLPFADGYAPYQQPYDLHSWFWPVVTPAAWPALGVVGVLSMMVRRPAMAAGWVVSALALTLVYGGVWDNPTTYLRASLPALPVLAVATGLGLVEAARAWQRLHVAAGATLVTTAVLAFTVSLHPTFTHAYPVHRDFEVVRQAASIPEPVHTLTVDDLLPGIDPSIFNLVNRRAMSRLLQQPASLTALLDASDPVGRWVLLPATCGRAVEAHIRPHYDPQRQPVLVAGRVWGLGFLRGGSVVLRERLWPCWADAVARTCLTEAEPCPQWTCVAPEPLPADPPPFIDPACAAVRERFVLDPVLEHTTPPGALDERGRILQPQMPLGLYRITGTTP
jgi:hypothetical protein